MENEARYKRNVYINFAKGILKYNYILKCVVE